MKQLLAFVCLLSLITEHSGQPTLKLVSLVYRHGDRNPMYMYPTDPYQVEAWPQGLGWLTTLGMNQQYELGQWLRKRYIDTGFMNDTFKREEIFVTSSDEDRCLMSAYCNLAGLYPPNSDRIWNQNISWQPIPVQTRPAAEDNMLNLGAYCPRYDQLLFDTINSEAVKDVEKRNKPFFEFLSNMTHLSTKDITNIWKVADTVYCERCHNLSLPHWVNTTVYNKLRELESYQFVIRSYNQEMSMLKGGPLLAQMINNMVSKISMDADVPKMFMYSAHDTTLAALLSALQVFNEISPGYASTVLVELHQNGSQKYVNVLYKNHTDSEDVLTLVIPGCSKDCPFDDFVRLTTAVIPTNWSVQCGLTKPDKAAVLSIAWIVVIVFGCMMVALVLAGVVCCIRSRRNETYRQLVTSG